MVKLAESFETNYYQTPLFKISDYMNRTEQNRILLRTPKGCKAHEDTICYIIDGIYDSVNFINDIQTNEI